MRTLKAPPKTAVIGAMGLVGQALFEACRRAHPDAVGTDWRGRQGLPRLDLAAPDPAPLRLAESGHRWVVIAAGMVQDYSECERRKSYTRARNVAGTLELSRLLARQGLRVACFSSDAVFDGETGGYGDDAPTRPVNEYGRQKAELERALPGTTGGRCLILRIGRVLGTRKGDGTLLDETARRLASGRRVVAARDQVFTPVVLSDLPKVLFALEAAQAEGVFNVAGPETVSRLDLARRLAQALGAEPELVRAVALDQVRGAVRRPRNLALRCERLSRALGADLTPVSACLAAVARNYAPGARTSGSRRSCG